MLNEVKLRFAMLSKAKLRFYIMKNAVVVSEARLVFVRSAATLLLLIYSVLWSEATGCFCFVFGFKSVLNWFLIIMNAFVSFTLCIFSPPPEGGRVL